jgi:hypothetical protein
MCNDWVLWDKGISDQARVTYLALLRFARQDGKCFPGQVKLARGRRVSERTLRDHLAELENRGLITIQRRGNGRTNMYWIEPLHDVYGSEDNPWEPSLEAQQQCWSPVGKPADAKPEEGWADRQRRAVGTSLVTGAAAILAAGDKSRDRADEKAVERERKRGQKVDHKKAVRLGKTKVSMKTEWNRFFKAAFEGASTQKWVARDKQSVERMIDTYGQETTLKAMESLCSEWESRYQAAWNVSGLPNIGILWGFRDKIFPEIETGRRLDPKKKNRLRDDEYQEGTADNARGGQW